MSIFPEGTIEQRLEAILTEHRPGERIRQECRCGNHPGHLLLSEHQAEMVVAELGLHRSELRTFAGQFAHWQTPPERVSG